MTTIYAQLIHETDRAILIDAGTGEVWLPKSMVQFDHSSASFAMPTWLAKKKNLIG